MRFTEKHELDFLIELKRPSVKLSDEHMDQLICYGQRIIASNPQMSHLKIMLFNGKSAFIGHISRRSHVEMTFTVANEQLMIYKPYHILSAFIFTTLTRKSLAFNKANLGIIFAMLKFLPKSLAIVYNFPDFGTVSLKELVGIGAESLVYDIEEKGEGGEDLVAKFYNSSTSYQTEIEALQDFEEI